MIQALRDPLFYGRLPTVGDTIYTVVAAVAGLALGAYVFSRVDDQIAVEV
jgi:ABC-type polysaccharide/polyol phosphate export permease